MNERFLADSMLARLARWLRVLNFDTAYAPHLDDAGLVRLAADQQRTLLTRDRHLVRFLRPTSVLLIRDDSPLQQLREVMLGCALQPPTRLFLRCLVCNTPLRAAEPMELHHAPAWARSHDDPILFCTACGRTYWHGSHTRRMRRQLAAELPEWFAAQAPGAD